MRKFLLASTVFMAISGAALAEPSFDQMQTLIEQHNYRAAASGLEEVIRNHPNSAKAFYAMSQAQAGLGNLDKARYALDKARGLDPELKFASSSSVRDLESAITPQTSKIEAVHEGHFWRNVFILLGLGGGTYAAYYFFCPVARRKRGADGNSATGGTTNPYTPQTPPSGPSSDEAARAYTSTNAAATGTVRPATAPVQPAYAPQPAYAQAPQPTVVNNYHSSNNDLLTGVLIAETLNNNHRDHETVIVQQPVYEEAPRSRRNKRDDDTPPASSSWDNAPASSPSTSRSSSWDDSSSSSSSSSSSWDSGSSSSSSWDSGSSSSDSGGSDSSW